MQGAIPSPGLGVDTWGWTQVAYHSTAARSGLTIVNALADQSYNIIGNRFQVNSQFSKFAAAYAGGAVARNALLTAPSLRKYAPVNIAPLDSAAVPSAPTPFEYLGFYNPLPITTGDQLEADFDNENTSEYDTVLVWFEKNARMPVKGEIFTVRGLGSTTLTAHAWTLLPFVLDNSLEEGIYAIVGMAVHTAHCIAARLVFPGVANSVRPGCIGQQADNAIMPKVFRYGRLGVWGLFDAAVQPQLEVLSTTADTAEIVWLDLVKLTIGSQAMAVAFPGMPITQAMGVSPAPGALY